MITLLKIANWFAMQTTDQQIGQAGVVIIFLGYLTLFYLFLCVIFDGINRWGPKHG